MQLLFYGDGMKKMWLGLPVVVFFIFTSMCFSAEPEVQVKTQNGTEQAEEMQPEAIQNPPNCNIINTAVDMALGVNTEQDVSGAVDMIKNSRLNGIDRLTSIVLILEVTNKLKELH